MNASPGPADAAFAALLLDSHARLVGRPLVDAVAGERADAIWLYDEAPFGLLAHDTSVDPLFTYANRAAQACFGYAWEELVGLPSRLSAETPSREAREALLAAVARDGFVAGYSGIRIAKSGWRFWIDHAVIWELLDHDGVRHGQAAIIRSFRDVDATVGA